MMRRQPRGRLQRDQVRPQRPPRARPLIAPSGSKATDDGPDPADDVEGSDESQPPTPGAKPAGPASVQAAAGAGASSPPAVMIAGASASGVARPSADIPGAPPKPDKPDTGRTIGTDITDNGGSIGKVEATGKTPGPDKPAPKSATPRAPRATASAAASAAPAPPERQILIGLAVTGIASLASSQVFSWSLFTSWMLSINGVMLGALLWDWSRQVRGKKFRLSRWFFRLLAAVGGAPVLHMHRTLFGVQGSSGLSGAVFHAMVVVYTLLFVLAALFAFAGPAARWVLDGIKSLFA